ncbi:helix-turn-helix domain-containing protein [Neisseria weixii]|uniref:helix-turn-helix domain-containing protein n=1 Tax=Neisseria weixii TaxID=1853276 RepID=UPI00359FE33F
MLFAPKTGANNIVPKIGAMKNLRLSIYSTEHLYLRQMLTARRIELGLSQRALAERLDVVHSFIGKVETGDRRLDLFEFLVYCEGLELDSLKVIEEIIHRTEPQKW